MSGNERMFRAALELLTIEQDLLAPQGIAPGVAEFVTQSRGWTAGARVVAFGIGERSTAGSRLDEVALKVYVTEKQPKSRLDASERIPSSVEIPDIAKALPIDVEAIGVLRPELLTQRARPLIPGYSVGHTQENTGTLGCVAMPRGGKGDLILSNCHILARYGFAAAGDAIIQPGRYYVAATTGFLYWRG